MGKMVDGQWYADDISSARTKFMRSPTVFRDEVTAADVEPGRYHLYVSYACPWAHRTLVVRTLRGLNDAISVSVVHPDMGDDGWRFDASFPGLRRVRDYPNLWAFVGRMLQLPGVQATTNLEHIKRHYFRSHESINPKRLVPLGPADPLPS